MITKAKLQQSTDGVINVAGELTYSTAHQALIDASSLLAQSSNLVMDLRDVSRSDSAGLALLVEWARFAKTNNKTIVFQNLPRQMLAIASVSGLNDLLPIKD